MLCFAPVLNSLPAMAGDGGKDSQSIEVDNISVCNWLCLDDVLGSFYSWSIYGCAGSVEWNFLNVFADVTNTTLFHALYPGIHTDKLFINNNTTFSKLVATHDIIGMEEMFIPYSNGTLTSCLSSIIRLVPTLQ